MAPCSTLPSMLKIPLAKRWGVQFGYRLLDFVASFHHEIGSDALAIVLERHALDRYECIKLCQPRSEAPDVGIAAPHYDLEKSRVDGAALLFARGRDLLDRHAGPARQGLDIAHESGFSLRLFQFCFQRV